MITLTVNGIPHAVDLPEETPLLWVLRDHLGMTGTKFGCGMSLCGACTVHLDGVATRSCVTPLSAVGARPVVTIEGIEHDPLGRQLQEAWLTQGVPQCGYCQPGQIMTAMALLRNTPRPTDQEIETAMNGNLCRCGTYLRIRAAVRQAAGGTGKSS